MSEITTPIGQPFMVVVDCEEVQSIITIEVFESVASLYNQFSDDKLETLNVQDQLDVINTVSANFESDEVAQSIINGERVFFDSSHFNDSYWDMIYDLTGWDSESDDEYGEY